MTPVVGLPASVRLLPADDPSALADLVGDAPVVAIGENKNHGVREFGALRERLVRHLVRELGFGVVAVESGYAEGFLVDAWVRGGPGAVEDLARRRLHVPRGRRPGDAGAGHGPAGAPGGGWAGPLRGPGHPGVGRLAGARAAARPGAPRRPRPRRRAPRRRRPGGHASLRRGEQRGGAGAVRGARRPGPRRRDRGPGAAAPARRGPRARGRSTAPPGTSHSARCVSTSSCASSRCCSRPTRRRRWSRRGTSTWPRRSGLLREETGERVVVLAHNGHVQRVPFAFMPGVSAPSAGTALAEAYGDELRRRRADRARRVHAGPRARRRRAPRDRAAHRPAAGPGARERRAGRPRRRARRGAGAARPARGPGHAGPDEHPPRDDPHPGRRARGLRRAVLPPRQEPAAHITASAPRARPRMLRKSKHCHEGGAVPPVSSRSRT